MVTVAQFPGTIAREFAWALGTHVSKYCCWLYPACPSKGRRVEAVDQEDPLLSPEIGRLWGSTQDPILLGGLLQKHHIQGSLPLGLYLPAARDSSLGCAGGIPSPHQPNARGYRDSSWAQSPLRVVSK